MDAVFAEIRKQTTTFNLGDEEVSAGTFDTVPYMPHVVLTT
jgi:hypothetical protein